MKNLLIVISILLLACCGTKETSQIPELDVTKSYPEKEIILQDVADVEYIALETSDGFLVGYPTVKYLDDDILIMHNGDGTIMIFDRKTGKGLHSFNHMGRGPGEYSGIFAITADGDKGEIFVKDPNYLPIYVFDMQGKPLRTIDLQRNLGMFGNFHDWDDGHLFVYSPFNPRRPDRIPYYLISKTDSTVTELPLRFEGRDGMGITEVMANGVSTRGIGARHDGVVKTTDGYVVSEPGVDTLYRFNPATGEMTPLMARTPAFGSMTYPVGLFYRGESRDYIFLQTVERKYDFETRSGMEKVQLIYDKREGKFYEGNIVNGDFADPVLVSISGSTSFPPGVIVEGIQPIVLIEEYEKGGLQGRPAEIVASGLKEDDNFILMIATLKQ